MFWKYVLNQFVWFPRILKQRVFNVEFNKGKSNFDVKPDVLAIICKLLCHDTLAKYKKQTQTPKLKRELLVTQMRNAKGYL